MSDNINVHNSGIAIKRILPYLYAVAAAAALTACDQITKFLARTKLTDGKTFSVIKKVIRFNYVKNTGAAWGIMSGKQAFFIVLTIVMLILIAFFYIKIPSSPRYTALKAALTVLFAGALGNLIDRIGKGYVDDFIDFYIINFPVFNFADICVCISMFSLLILICFVYKDGDFDFVKNIFSRNSQKDGVNE